MPPDDFFWNKACAQAKRKLIKATFSFTKHPSEKLSEKSLGPLELSKVRNSKELQRHLVGFLFPPNLSISSVLNPSFWKPTWALESSPKLQIEKLPRFVKCPWQSFPLHVPKCLHMVFSETKLVPTGALQAKRKLTNARKILSWPFLRSASPTASWHFWADLKDLKAHHLNIAESTSETKLGPFGAHQV